MTEKRKITKRQEQALRLVHHDFIGLSRTEAAKKMNIGISALNKLLAAVKKVLPQFFPLLSKIEMKCYHLYAAEGWSVSEIANHLGKSQTTIYESLVRARSKGMFFSDVKGRVLSYEPSMDNDIKEQF